MFLYNMSMHHFNLLKPHEQIGNMVSACLNSGGNEFENLH